MAMYPRVVTLKQGNLRPSVVGHVLVRRTGLIKDLTGLQSTKFWMWNKDTDLVKINGVAGALLDLPLGKIGYTWTGTDTDTLGHFTAWFVGYWGAGDTLPETFDGFEVYIVQPKHSMVS